MKLTLIRDPGKGYPTIPQTPTYGRLIAVGGAMPEMQTLELPWRDNATDVSCIPAGDYTIIRRHVGGFATRYKQDYGHDFALEITPVDGRIAILIHIGNWMRNTLGCVLVGLGRNEGERMITSSKDAYLILYEALHPHLKEAPVPLKVISAYAAGDEADFADEVREAMGKSDNPLAL